MIPDQLAQSQTSSATSSAVSFRACVVIPVYRHAATLPPILAHIKTLGLPVILVNDGGDAEDTARLREFAQDGLISLREQFPNRGKGAAVATGLRYAVELGYTHALQIDADGQHDPADIARFLTLAEAQPDAVIAGVPQYDDSVPRHRLYARYITHFWVWIETLSFAIRDSMCGFRVYPLGAAVALMDSQPLGSRMDFDTQVLVRLFWRGVNIVSVPTRVVYPVGGISNFRPWRDNILLTAMHTRLCCGMLLRLPLLLWRKLRRTSRSSLRSNP